MDSFQYLTVELVATLVEEVKAVRLDDEAAHSKEDVLHEMVLRAIAEGAKNPRKLAREALKTLDIQFSRYCA